MDNNIGNSIEATAIANRIANTMLGLKNQLHSAMADLYIEASKDFATRFDENWKDIKKEYGDKVKKVKEGFVRDVSFKVMAIQANMHDSPKGYMKAMTPIPEIIRRVFEYHYFYKSDLPDNERARLQKDENYQNQVAIQICENIVRDSGGMFVNQVFTQYHPVIYSARHLIDLYAIILNTPFNAVLKNEPDEYRLTCLLELFANALWKAKNVFDQMVYSSPSDAVINMRTFFEIEQMISIVNRYNYNFSKIYTEFSQFAILDDIDSNPELLSAMSGYAERFGKRVEDYGFKNYGWMMFIDDKMPLNFKSVLKLNNCEYRYDAYRDASKYVHYRENPFNFDPNGVAEFVIAEMYNSMTTIAEEFNKFVTHYGIKLESTHAEHLQLLYDSYDKTTLKFIQGNTNAKLISKN